jgi:hypothetical protein
VTSKAAVWPLLFVSVRLYVPGAKPDGSVTVSRVLLKESTTAWVVAKTTVGVSPAGLKSCPVAVIRFCVKFTTMLKIFGVATSARIASAIRERTRNRVERCCLSIDVLRKPARL